MPKARLAETIGPREMTAASVARPQPRSWSIGQIITFSACAVQPIATKFVKKTTPTMYQP